HRVVVDDREGLERDIELLAVIQQRDVVIGNAHRTGIDVEALVELAMLGETAQFLDGVAAANGDVTSARLALIFQDLNLVASAAEFERRRETSQTRAQHQYGSALHITRKLEGAAITGLAR